MRKQLISLALVLVGAQAFAMTAQEYEYTRQYCTTVASIAGVNFVAKQRGDPPRPLMPPGYRQEPMMALVSWAKRYAWNSATSKQDAMNVAAAKCVDNLRNVTFAERDKQLMSETDLR